MSAEKARWMLACALAKYQEGTRLLRVYDSVLNNENRQNIENSRNDYEKVVRYTVNRLSAEAKA